MGTSWSIACIGGSAQHHPPCQSPYDAITPPVSRQPLYKYTEAPKHAPRALAASRPCIWDSQRNDQRHEAIEHSAINGPQWPLSILTPGQQDWKRRTLRKVSMLSHVAQISTSHVY